MTIYTSEKTGVLCVPTKALRFTPTAETVGKEWKIADCNGKNKLWTIEGNTLKAHAVKTGMTDGSQTEIVSGITKGTTIVSEIKVSSGDEEAAQQGNTERSPFAPGPPNRNRKK